MLSSLSLINYNSLLYLFAHNCKHLWASLSAYIEEIAFRRFVKSYLDETIVVYVDLLLNQVCRTLLGAIENTCVLVISGGCWDHIYDVLSIPKGRTMQCFL